MTNAKLFKKIAAINLTEALYQQMEPHLDTLLIDYEQIESAQSEIAFHESKLNYRKYHQIREEFNKLMHPAWLAFAREHWPGIDSVFDIEQSTENDALNNDNLDWL